MSWLSNALGTSAPGAPTLPQAPTLVSPTLPQYPNFSQNTQNLLTQQQGNLSGAQGAVQAYGNNPYLQQSQQADTQALTNYQNALQGKIAPNQMMAQQKTEAWNQMVQQAAQQGIKINGSNPQSAVSQSTAGNQQIADFNKSWAAQEQNYNLGQQQIGMQQQAQALGQQNQQYQNTMGGYNTLSGMNTSMQAPYAAQTQGQYQQATNQVTSDANIQNQNAMNAYQQQLQQIGLNYNTAQSGYQNSMGLASGIGSLAGTVGGAMIGGPVGAMIGGQAGGLIGGGQTQGGNSGMMGNMGSFIQAYKQPQGMGFTGVPSSQINYGTGNVAPPGYAANNTYGG